MARSCKSIYGKYDQCGLSAYDFKPIGLEHPGDYGKIIQPADAGRKKAVGNGSPAFAVAAVLCAVLLFAALMSQSSLVAVSEEASMLRMEIAELSQQQKELKIEHAMAFSLSDTEEYAVEVLGMQKPAAQQICYLEVNHSQTQGESEENHRNALDLLSIIKEYFPG